jgi:LDH2 family malate/lactate/ureidoglycolate dehydrogenase
MTTPDHVRTATPEHLLAVGARVFEFHGAPSAAARTVATSLVQASLMGHDSHGILRVARYVEKIVQGALNPAAVPQVQRQFGATAVVDGGRGFGQVTAAFGADRAIQLAHAHGIGAVALARTNHVGRLGEYVERISGAGHIGLAFASGAGPGGSVAPYGGRERIFGTNPIAWALPVPDGRGPLVADFSTSLIPEGKIALAHAQGQFLPPGAVLDREGHATTDAQAFYAGGALLPFGGHKGSSLMLLIEVMASLLAGSVPSSSSEYRPGNPTLLLAWSIDAFTERDEYLRHTAALLDRIESSRPAEGFTRVVVPNALELETERQRRVTGIPIPEPVWDELETLSRDAGARLTAS